MLGHIGLNIPDLTVAKQYYDALMPALGFTEYFNATEDEFSYWPSGGKPGTYIFFYPASDPGPYGVNRTGFQHLAFMVPTRQAVRDAYEIAMRLGALSCIPRRSSRSIRSRTSPRFGAIRSDSRSRPSAITTADREAPVVPASQVAPSDGTHTGPAIRHWRENRQSGQSCAGEGAQ